MRPAFIIIALSAFAVARPFESPSVNARSDDLLKGLFDKAKAGVQGLATAAVPHLTAALKDAAHAVVGEACDQAKQALSARSLNVADYEANLEFVAQETYQQMVDDHAIEDSAENYDFIKSLLKAGSTKLLEHGCDKAQAALTARDVDNDDGLVDAYHKIKSHVVNVVKGIKDKLTGHRVGKAAPAAAPAAAAAPAEEAAAPAEPAAEVAA